MSNDEIKQVVDFVEKNLLDPYMDSMKRASTIVVEQRRKLLDLKELLEQMSSSDASANNEAKKVAEDKYANFTTIFS